MTSESNIAVGDDAAGNAVEANDFLKEQLCDVGGVSGFRASYKMGHLAESVDDHQDGVELAPRAWQTQDEVQADFLPGGGGNRKRKVASRVLLGKFSDSACGTTTNHTADVPTEVWPVVACF